jgi:hypothetical protein
MAREDELGAAFGLVRQISYVIRHSPTIHKIGAGDRVGAPSLVSFVAGKRYWFPRL